VQESGRDALRGYAHTTLTQRTSTLDIILEGTVRAPLIPLIAPAARRARVFYKIVSDRRARVRYEKKQTDWTLSCSGPVQHIPVYPYGFFI
jgi:hypothetical protein